VRLFFFHYDCQVNGRRALSVREGQAGFFTEQELAQSAGILWRPEEQEIRADARVDRPSATCTKVAFTRGELDAFAHGDLGACFGPGFTLADTHVRTPRIQGDRMLFHDEITRFDAAGGPWQRGYLRSVQRLSPKDWFFDGHFKNDPCMPGTLMFEGCLQLMSFYLAAMGYTLDRDGWRFQPIPDEPYQLLCRGQVIPTSSELVYEIFVEEVHDGPRPTLYADLLCTVDGLKAFHARRMGLALVPDWPLSSRPELLAHHVEPRPVAEVDGFKFDYASLLACAWGRPSKAFGRPYQVFDDIRRVARLPGPPYHFMSRVTRIDGPMGVCQPGAEIEIEYDVAGADQWYFGANGHPTMPFCVLLEAVLQPCGWLASFVGSALTTDHDLAFRNLDGAATFAAEVFPADGTLRTVVKLTSVSQSAGMIIESFDVRAWVGDTLVYELSTVFGFFPRAALANQVGLTTTDAQRACFDAPRDYLVDLSQRPAKYCQGSLRLPEPMLLMLDRITAFDAQGGSKGLGALRAEKDVRPSEWFFKAHFFQDPVQPGSLGLEAALQALQFYMLEAGLAQGIDNPRFEPVAVGRKHAWKYRGQVVPTSKLITTTLDITDVGRDERGAYAVADGSLWVDGKRIYESHAFAMRIVAGPPAQDSTREETLDPARARDRWLADHRPTFVLPALPMMSMVDRLAAAATSAIGPVSALRDVQVRRWLRVDRPTRLSTDAIPTVDGADVRLLAFREASDPRLSRFEPVATARATRESLRTPAPLPALVDAAVESDPYASGRLFHGPAFRYLTKLVMGSNGSTAWLYAGAGDVPFGALGQGLLDALTHGVPHDDLRRWSDQIGDDVVAYPYRIPEMFLHAPLPTDGAVRVEARFDGFDGAAAYPAFRIHTFSHADDRLLVDLRLVEILLPKGPIGAASPDRRLAFLRDRRYVAGLGLARLRGDETRASSRDVQASDWLPGTVAGLYGTGDDVVREVAIKDHLARRHRLHPSLINARSDGAVAASAPLTLIPLSVRTEGGDVVVRDADGPPRLDLTRVRDFWQRCFGLGRWPAEDLFYALIERFVGAVRVEDPGALAALRGRPVLFVGNHQIAVESLLFSVIASSLVETPTLTLAKPQHAQTWLGRLSRHGFTYPGARDPGLVAYFDRSQPESLPRIIQSLGAGLAAGASSLMVHVEGTRSLHCGAPVSKMSGVFLELAIQANLPVVPVRFVGGLPLAPLPERVDFPVGMGRQDFWLGTPIDARELAALPYKERTARVLAAINGLGPSAETEVPFAGDPTFEASVRAWIEQTGAEHAAATVFRALEGWSDPEPSIAALIEGARDGALVVPATPKGEWLAELARRLYGPRGPSVRVERLTAS
jgi:3-hydroxymyristoyl/3-hydroxydecanoyl-(acyl carrier protein) dehydratase/1-acyl-sn-glycerol-3-phosphate acyltransferase